MTGDPQYIAQMEGSLLLTNDGVWIHNGVRFQNEKLSDLFSRSIVWDDTANRYYLEIGKQRATFSHERYVFFVKNINDSTNPWILEVSNGEQIALQPDSLSVDSEGQISCSIGGKHRASFLRTAHQTVAPHIVGNDTISIGGQRFKIKELV